ncbi:MAG: flagellar biosynthetic protein FliQ [Oscillospiraceae bacterium]|nr:flagellar biosynthetic protein FliQ [Oscillospiraceae bacterium]
MSQGDIISIIKDTVMTALLISAPFLLVSAAIGIIISVFQAATQIHEQNISFVFKIVAIGVMLVLLFSWLNTTMIDFTNRTFASIQSLV